jgi:hypothetical protein
VLPAVAGSLVGNVAGILLVDFFRLSQVPIIALPDKAPLFGVLRLRRRLFHVVAVEWKRHTHLHIAPKQAASRRDAPGRRR